MIQIRFNPPSSRTPLHALIFNMIPIGCRFVERLHYPLNIQFAW